MAEIGGALVGHLAVTLGFSLGYRGRDAFIGELCIDARHRGPGPGTEAMQVAECHCRDQGVRAPHLEAGHHREAAPSLCRGQGFEARGRVPMTKPPDTRG